MSVVEGTPHDLNFPPIALAARFFAYSYDSAPVHPRAILTDTGSDASLALDRLGVCVREREQRSERNSNS